MTYTHVERCEMPEVHPDAALLTLLEARPRLRLTLLDRDYGTPCAEDRWHVKGAIDHALKPSLLGMVLDVDILERDDGTCDDVLVIGVVSLETTLPKIRDVLMRLNVPAGATLVMDGAEENLLSDLPVRDELVRRETDSVLQQVLVECINCAPPDWQAGTLTIQCDGNWLGYKLKNADSRKAATISPHLRALCEELAVLMWRNGNQWREAVLQYEGTKFSIAFSYDEPLHPIPRVSPPTPAKAWWKLW